MYFFSTTPFIIPRSIAGGNIVRKQERLSLFFCLLSKVVAFPKKCRKIETQKSSNLKVAYPAVFHMYRSVQRKVFCRITAVCTVEIHHDT